MESCITFGHLLGYLALFDIKMLMHLIVVNLLINLNVSCFKTVVYFRLHTRSGACCEPLSMGLNTVVLFCMTYQLHFEVFLGNREN